MKSLALSLLVALGVSLGATSVSAEPVSRGTPTAFAQMQEAAAKSSAHAARAQEYRVKARLERAAAGHCLRIATDDDKQGFKYEAGVMREKAKKHVEAAIAFEKAAEREDALANHWRRVAQQHLVQHQGTMTGR